MGKLYDLDASELIKKAALELEKSKEVKMPAWAKFVKTGVHKERPPIQDNWWYLRAASILRRIYMFGPLGVSKLRKKYGGLKNKGHKPGHQYRGSGKIARSILQQLEKEGLIRQVEKGVHKGRVVTPKGKSLLDKIAKK